MSADALGISSSRPVALSGDQRVEVRVVSWLDIFVVLDQVVTRPDAILASNTSSIPLVRLAVATSRPEQVMGVHFFNPAPVQRLVELIPALTTGSDTVKRVEHLVTEVLGKHAIRAQDRSGPAQAVARPFQPDFI